MKTMKKSMLALAAGLGFLAFNPSQSNAKDPDFKRVVNSLRDCAYSSYKNQSSPSQENASKEKYACSKFNAIKQEKGISSLEDYFEKNGPGKYGWFYNDNGDYINGKVMKSHYAAKIVRKFEKEGTPIYYTKLGDGVDSFRGKMYNMNFINTIPSSDGTKKIVIDLESIEKNARGTEKVWKGYISNHNLLLKGDLNKFNPLFEPTYLSLIKYKNIKNGYLNEKLNSIITHEFEHVKGSHAHNDTLGENIACSAGANNSPIALYDIQEEASKGKQAETAVLKCLMGTEDIFNKQNQAKFYLKGRQYIQQKALSCKKQFLRQRQNR